MNSKDIVARRERVGLTQQQVANLIGVSRNTYIKYEQHPEVMPLGKYETLNKELRRLRLKLLRELEEEQ